MRTAVNEGKSGNQLQVSLIRHTCHGGGAAAVSRRRPVLADAWGSQPRWEGTGWEGQWERGRHWEVGEAIGRNRVRQIGEGRGKMPLVASHSDAHMQAKHTRAHADLQSRLLFIVSLLAKEITSGALNQIIRWEECQSSVCSTSGSSQHFSGEQKGNPLLIRGTLREAGHSRDYSFFSYCGFLSFHREQIGWPVSFGSFCHSSPEHFPCLLLSSFSPRPTKQGFFTGLYVGEQEGGEAVPHGGVFELWMLTHSFWTREEPDPTWAAQADATATDASLGFTSWYHPFSRPALQHVPFCEALPSLPSSRTMCKWKVTKGASAWFHLSCLSLPLLLLLLCSALPVACHDTHRAVRAPRGANSSSSAVVGRHVRSYNHLMGDVHKRKLFSFQKFFLRIDKNGKVNGTKSKDDPYSE